MNAGQTWRVAGCDLGKARAKFVVGRVGPSAVEVVSAECVAHGGRPMEAFARWYAGLDTNAIDAIGATGLHADELTAPVVCGLPEDACVEAALPHVWAATGPLNVVSVCARGYALVTRDQTGRIQSLRNDKCSSGTGETMVKIAHRFGLAIDEADTLACGATESIPITARCSVFAKSEMTHFGNQGRPVDALFAGYFASVARSVAGLLARVRVPGPVAVIGGGAEVRALVRAFEDLLGEAPVLLDGARHVEAVGALRLAAAHVARQGRVALPDSAAVLIVPREDRLRRLEAARSHAGRVRRLEAAPIPEGAVGEPAILGLDLGSTGSKAVLTSIETGEMVFDLYDRTRGNPVEASLRLIAGMLEQAPDVRAVALTGSGREAAATVLRAAWPDQADRIVVQNEIVAHGTAAVRCDEDAGRSLSVVEIGGQDAKFIQIVGGQIVESDMNKACSAGTGSFLEEQAVFHGVDDIGTFTRLAAEASAPPDLGQMCTVFVADAAAEAQNEGFDVADIFGGYQYSIVHNYLDRVMGQRAFGDRIFFQGKPATGASLPWTLAAVTGREVVVPANPGAMGAWGIGLLTIDTVGRDALAAAPSFDLTTALDAAVVDRADFQCADRACATLCTIDRTTVAVGGAARKVYSGGACPKYEISTARSGKLPKDAPSPFDERAALLSTFVGGGADEPRSSESGTVVGIPHVGALHGVLPWLVAFVRKLGLEPRVLSAGPDALSKGEALCYSFDACAPVKIAHGALADLDGVDAIFFPKLLGFADREGPDGRTCPMEQALPEMVGRALDARGRGIPMVAPLVDLARTGNRGQRAGDVFARTKALHRAARALGAADGRVASAIERAHEAQHEWEAGLAAIGRRALGWARRHDRRVILVAGALHVVHDDIASAGIPRLLRRNGVIPLPMDCFPIPPETHALPRVPWGDANRTLRAAVAARNMGDVYPLFLTSFGCGPASFSEQIFGALMAGYPHTALESDGHGGTAGYVTRVQAFLHTVDQHDGRPDLVSADRLTLLEPLPAPPIAEQDTRVIVFPFAGLSKVIAATYRAFGVDAVSAPDHTPDSFADGKRDCSGKECLPYQLIWGGLKAQLDRDGLNGDGDDDGRHATLLQVNGQGMCRNCLFSTKDQLTLERHGLQDRVSVRHFSREVSLSRTFQPRVWLGNVGWDILNQLAAYHRLDDEAAADALYLEHEAALMALLERPARHGLGGVADFKALEADIGALVTHAAHAFAELRSVDGPEVRTVLVTGDVYLRGDDFASDDVPRRLAARGLRVVLEPTSALVEYMAEERLSELMGLATGRFYSPIQQAGLAWSRKRLYARVRPLHPWLPPEDLPGVLDAASEMLNRYPRGEAPMAIGTVLHHWRAGVYDGAAVVNPWGCGPALVGESLLRHATEIPLLFVYGDGTPIDDRRLNAFAFRLRRGEPRAVETAMHR